MNPDIFGIIPPWAAQAAIIYAGCSLVATLLVQFIPTPQEIQWKPYVILFNTLQRLSIHRRPWSNGSNGK